MIACLLITCCSSPDLPSAADFRARINAAAGRCPHPAGDRWTGIAGREERLATCAGCEQRVELPEPTAHRAVAQGRFAWSLNVLQTCSECDSFVRPLDCDRLETGGLRRGLERRDLVCPIGKFNRDRTADTAVARAEAAR